MVYNRRQSRRNSRGPCGVEGRREARDSVSSEREALTTEKLESLLVGRTGEVEGKDWKYSEVREKVRVLGGAMNWRRARAKIWVRVVVVVVVVLSGGCAEKVGGRVCGKIERFFRTAEEISFFREGKTSEVRLFEVYTDKRSSFLLNCFTSSLGGADTPIFISTTAQPTTSHRIITAHSGHPLLVNSY